MLSLVMKGKAQERAANFNVLEKSALTFQGRLRNEGARTGITSEFVPS
jgi:hypothetical protein